MKATLTFNLPTDKKEFELCVFAIKRQKALQEFDKHCDDVICDLNEKQRKSKQPLDPGHLMDILEEWRAAIYDITWHPEG